MAEQRVAVITGGTKGIGRAAAGRLERRGFDVVVIARSAPEAVGPGRFVAADLSAEDDIRRVCGQLPRIDVLVNNVAGVRPAMLEDATTDDLRAVLELNLMPALLLTQAAVPGMRERRWGRIINVTSLVALGAVQRTAYGAAKSALTFFTRGWALELAADGVTVNAVAPGPTETELFRAGNPVGSDGEARYLSMIPMKRFAQPGEIAGAIEFLASDDAGFMTGQVLWMDGGASVGRPTV